MKFGKSLSNQVQQALPDWKDKFLSYKELKKHLKVIEANEGDSCKRPRLDPTRRGGAEEDFSGKTMEESVFIRLLGEEIKKLNDFFIEKEEEYIIRIKELKLRLAMARESKQELMKARKEIVDFHGEMVLLENYSAINYTGLVKILKKYDKKTGALIRLPFIQEVLMQPFFNTEPLYKLIKECESMLDQLLPATAVSIHSGPSATGAAEDDGGEDAHPQHRIEGAAGADALRSWTELVSMECSQMRRAVSALRIMMDIRNGSSTVNVFSLPPMLINPLEDCRNLSKIPLLEQVAK